MLFAWRLGLGLELWILVVVGRILWRWQLARGWSLVGMVLLCDLWYGNLRSMQTWRGGVEPHKSPTSRFFIRPLVLFDLFQLAKAHFRVHTLCGFWFHYLNLFEVYFPSSVLASHRHIVLQFPWNNWKWSYSMYLLNTRLENGISYRYSNTNNSNYCCSNNL